MYKYFFHVHNPPPHIFHHIRSWPTTEKKGNKVVVNRHNLLNLARVE